MSQFFHQVSNQMMDRLRESGVTPVIQGYISSVKTDGDWSCTVRVPNAFGGIDFNQREVNGETYIEFRDVALPRNGEGLIASISAMFLKRNPAVLVGFKGRGGGMWFPYIVNFLDVFAEAAAVNGTQNRKGAQSATFGTAGAGQGVRPVTPGNAQRQRPIDPEIVDILLGGNTATRTEDRLGQALQGRLQQHTAPQIDPRFQNFLQTGPIKSDLDQGLKGLLQRAMDGARGY